jgi:hypothetical protein
MLEKSLTIRGTSLEDVNLFNKNKKSLKLSSPEYFSKILRHNCKDTAGVMTIDGSNQQAELLTLRILVEKLEKENKELSLKEPLIQEKEVEKIVYKDKDLLFPEYVYNPGNELAKKINRAIALERKNGNLKNVNTEDYLQKFTTDAINYFIKNEYDI